MNDKGVLKMTDNKKAKSDSELFNLGWLCAQEAMSSLHSDYYSNILTYVSDISLFGMSFKPDDYTATLKDGKKSSCKTKYEIIDRDTIKEPKYIIYTQYSYILPQASGLDLKLVVTPSLAVSLSSGNSDAPSSLMNSIIINYSFSYSDFYCKYRIFGDHSRGDCIYYDKDYEGILASFSKHLAESILSLLDDLAKEFTGFEYNLYEKKALSKKVYDYDKTRTQVNNLTTLLKIFTRDKDLGVTR